MARMTKKELVEKLYDLAQSWENGDPVDSFTTTECTDTALAYVSGCADDLRELLAKVDK